MDTPEIISADPNRHWFLAVAESKCCDTVFLTTFVALLVIGILASAGIFEFMGAASAAHLSYGMYAAAFAVCVLTIIKCVVTNCVYKQHTNDTPFSETKIGTLASGNTKKSGKPLSAPLKSDEIAILKVQAGFFVNDEGTFKAQDGSYHKDFQKHEEREAGKQKLMVLLLKLIDNPDFQNDPVSFMETLRLELLSKGTAFPNTHAFWCLFNSVKSMRTLPNPTDLVYWGFQPPSS